jgi:small multidrug resistance pump
MHYLYLGVAIVSEVIGTIALKSSEGFTRWTPSTIVVIGYASAFYFLSLCLDKIPVGIAYAIWSGIGIVLIAVLGVIVHKQRLDPGTVVGMALILAGVIVINVFSKSATH